MILDDTSQAIYSYLSAGTALTALLPGTASIYRTQAPDDATLPYVVFSHQGGGPEIMTPQSMETNLWYIRAYSDESQKEADEIFHQADDILNQFNPTLIYHHTINCVRVQNISFAENTPSGKIWNSGGVYSIRTSTPTYPTGAAPASYVVDRSTYLGYKEYTALLTQSGTGAPTETVIKNDTGATVTWARAIQGFYTGTFSSAVLTTNKTVQFINEQSNLYHYRTSWGGTTSVVVYTMNLTGTLVDGVLNGTPITIRIYN